MSNYVILPLTEDRRQMFTLDMVINSVALEARVEVRYLPAPNRWYISVWDHSSGDILVNMIPLVCSYEKMNDLFLPFAYKRGGKGLGTLFVLRSVDQPDTPDPSEKNIKQFNVLWGDTYEAES